MDKNHQMQYKIFMFWTIFTKANFSNQWFWENFDCSQKIIFVLLRNILTTASVLFRTPVQFWWCQGPLYGFRCGGSWRRVFIVLILGRGRLCLGLRGNVVELTGGGAAAGGRLGQDDDVGEVGSVLGHKGEVLVDSVLLNNLGSIMVHIQPWPESMTNETIKIEMSKSASKTLLI